MLVKTMVAELSLQRLTIRGSQNHLPRTSMEVDLLLACNSAMTSFYLELNKYPWEELVSFFIQFLFFSLSFLYYYFKS